MDTVAGQNPKYIRTRFGGGSSHTLTFNLLKVAQFRGGTKFRDTSAPKTCKNLAPGTAACQLEAMDHPAEVCLECTKKTTEKWIFSSSTDPPSVKCEVNNSPSQIKRTNTPQFDNVYTDCEAYQRNGGGSCQACHATCMSCSGSGNTKCTACDWEANLNLKNGKCQACGNGKVSAYGSCTSCNGGCNSCPNEVCGTSCSGVKDYYKGGCCADNQFMKENGGCGACDNSCISCYGSGNKRCLSCSPGTALNIFTGKCQGGCDLTNGKYLDPIDSTCKSCATHCLECQSAAWCTKCDASKSFKVENGQCVLDCDTSNAKFINNSNNPPTCDACPTGCLECTSAASGACSRCDVQNGYYKSSGNCLSCAVNNGKYISSSGDSCLSCSTGCKVCTDGSTCTRCKTGQGYYLQGTACSSCAITAGKYIPSSGDNCLNCADGNCLECSSNGATCTKCNGATNHYVKGDGSCGLCDVTNGKFIPSAGDACSNCSTNCLECSDASTCTKCSVGSPINNIYLKNAECKTCNLNNGKYVPTTKDKCLNCQDSNCKSCGSDGTTCSACKTGNGYYLDNASCSACAITNGKYIPNSGDSCQNCPSNCLECSDGDTCTKCDVANRYYLDSGTGDCTLCPAEKTLKSDGTGCYLCPDNCSACSSPTTCTTCSTQTGFYLNGNTCSSCSITNGKYIPTAGNSCQNCPSNCLECSDGSTCTKCDVSNGFYRKNDGSCGSCQTTAGKYIPTSGDACESCAESDCLECPSGSGCTKCDASAHKFLSGNSCSSCNVGNGQFISSSGDSCSNCSTGCLECSNEASCAGCNVASGFYLSGNVCLSCNTKNGFFVNSGGTSCSGCSENCLECNNESSCTKCDVSKGFYLHGNVCSSCSTKNGKFIPQAGNSCQDCPDNCLECSDGSTCSKCDVSKGFYVKNGACAVCPKIGKFINSGGSECLDCPQGCTECSGMSACRSCDASKGYFLSSGSCQSCDLKQGKYISPAGTSCINCPTGCSQCSDGISCSKCSLGDGYIQLPGSEKCSFCDTKNGFFIASKTSCKACPSNCRVCSSTTACTTCKKGYFLDKTGECDDAPENVEIYTLVQISPIEDELADFYLKVIIPELEKYPTGLSYDVFSDGENPRKIFNLVEHPVEGAAGGGKIASRTMLTLDKQLILMGNFTERENLTVDKISVQVTAINSILNINAPEVGLSETPLIKPVIIVPPVTNKAEKENSANQGETISGVSGGTSTALTGLAGFMGVLGADPSGTAIKFNQYLDFITRLRYINIFYGDKLEGFLGGMGHSKELTANTPKQRDRIIRLQNGDKGKFNKYSVKLDLDIRIVIKASILCLSWVLKLLAGCMLLKFKNSKEKKITKLGAYFIYYQRKIHFVVVGMSSTDISFYGTRLLLHKKLLFSQENWAGSVLLSLSLLLIAIDLYEQAELIRAIRSSSPNLSDLLEEEGDMKDGKSGPDKVHAAYKRKGSDNSKSRKNNKNGKIEPKNVMKENFLAKPGSENNLDGNNNSQNYHNTKEGGKNTQRSGKTISGNIRSSIAQLMLRRKKKIKLSRSEDNDRQILVMGKEIDYRRTLRRLSLNEPVEKFSLTGLSLTQQIINSRHLLMTHQYYIIKMAAQQLLLAALPNFPLLQILLIGGLQLAEVSNNVYSYLVKKHLNSFIVFASKALSGVFVLLFLGLSLGIRTKYGAKGLFVGDWTQDLGRYIIISGLFVEYGFMIILNIKLVIGLVFGYLNKKKVDNEKEKKRLTKRIGVKFTEYEESGPLVYLVRKKVAAVSPQNNGGTSVLHGGTQPTTLKRQRSSRMKFMKPRGLRANRRLMNPLGLQTLQKAEKSRQINRKSRDYSPLKHWIRKSGGEADLQILSARKEAGGPMIKSSLFKPNGSRPVRIQLGSGVNHGKSPQKRWVEGKGNL